MREITDICPACGGCGWTVDHDPLHPNAEDNGNVLIACICPDGEEVAELAAGVPTTADTLLANDDNSTSPGALIRGRGN